MYYAHCTTMNLVTGLFSGDNFVRIGLKTHNDLVFIYSILEATFKGYFLRSYVRPLW